MFGKHGFGGFPGRFFERGDFKFVILHLLKDKPRHGYEIIRALEERFGGFYAPSPGAVYPTLQMLEDLGYVTSEPQDGKKVYTITDAGRQFLAEQGPLVDEIWDRLGQWWGPRAGGVEWREVRDELRDIGRVMRGRARAAGDPEKLRRIREVIARARREIEEILREEPATRV